MKCFTINSKYITKFGDMSAEFYSLLDKKVYEEVYNLSGGEILKRIKSLNLSEEEIKLIQNSLRERGLNYWLFESMIRVNPHKKYILFLYGLNKWVDSLKKSIPNLQERIKRNEELLNKHSIKLKEQKIKEVLKWNKY